jgi:type I restriction enzyme S subunit
MREGWEIYKIGEIASVVGGGTPSTKVDEYYGGNIPWLTPKDLSNHTSKYIKSGARNITELGLERSSARLLPKGTVLFTSRAPIGYIAIAQNEVTTNQGFKSLICDEELAHNEYIYYLLKSKVKEIENIATGSTFKEISGGVLKEFEIELPPLPIQKKIARILSAFDDKIELNRRMNRTLEATAQAIFKSWFVDFDPVHAKAACRTEADYEAAAKRLGISREVLELFPSEFEESELGMIPKGWEVSTIGKEFSVVMGQSPAGSSYNEEKKGMIFFQGRRDFGDYYPTERVYTTEPKRIAQEDDILLSVRAPVGDINIALKKCCIGRGLAALKHKNGSVSYSFLVLKELKKHFENFNTEGTVFGSLNQKTLKNLSTFAYNCVIDEFAKKTDPIFQQIKANTKKIQTLQQTRDTLLPKLLSGELDIENIQEEDI